MLFSAQLNSFGVYIHVPFCARKCPYCDFNTYAGLGSLYERTVEALCTELSVWGERIAGRAVTSVFVGGGTPTVLADAQLSCLLETVQSEFSLAGDCEITVEANPGTVDREKFRLLHGLGVNRLSIGVQSFQPDELMFLGRIHGVDDVYRAYDAARAAGFDNLNLDFIFGLPNQALEMWEDTLNKAVALGPEHLSLYSLIVEPNTPLDQWVESGQVIAPDEDQTGEMYELAVERLSRSGYVHYEVSNWAKGANEEGWSAGLLPKRACRHNLLYWRNGEYVGIGPGAHSHLRHRDADGMMVSRRWSNYKSVQGYVRRIEEREPVEAFSEELSVRDSMGETMMLGLRLVHEGVSYRRFEQLHGIGLVDVYGEELQTLQKRGLVDADGERVRLTPRGLMLGNQAFVEFLPEATEAAAA
jgi:oxygen-independent coproporphyrinogen III oxidase